MKQTHSLFKVNGTDYSVPFMLIASLFFLWGFAHSILEVLNPHFQQSLSISKTKASLVQVAVYGGYFLMAIPAGYIVRRWGYRKGVLTGLLLYGLGALLFIPGSAMESFPSTSSRSLSSDADSPAWRQVPIPIPLYWGLQILPKGVSTWLSRSTEWDG